MVFLEDSVDCDIGDKRIQYKYFGKLLYRRSVVGFWDAKNYSRHSTSEVADIIVADSGKL